MSTNNQEPQLRQIYRSVITPQAPSVIIDVSESFVPNGDVPPEFNPSMFSAQLRTMGHTEGDISTALAVLKSISLIHQQNNVLTRRLVAHIA